MNKCLLSAIIVFLTIVNIPAQPAVKGETNDPIENSLDNLKFKTEVEWKAQSSITIVSKAQAKQQFKSLISKYGKKNITRLHKVYAKDKMSYYSVVKFNSADKDLRLFYYCEKVDNHFIITKVRIYAY